MSTLGDIMSTSVNTMNTFGGYHEYTGERSVHLGNIMSTSGDIMLHVGGGGGIMSTSGFSI